MSGPRIGFLIGGVQKGGTTALAHFMARHPALALPDGKEAHVFDAPDFPDGCSQAEVDRRYAPFFRDCSAQLWGDATPIYCFHSRFVERIAAYNRQMRWILLLRHPVERAISHYQMERRRGDEHWPFWPAMLLERWRLVGHACDFSQGSPLRHYSYRARGDYARQLDAIYRHFPRDQVLVLRSEALAQRPEATMQQVWNFLGIAPLSPAPAYGRVFEGGYVAQPRSSLQFRLMRWLMAAQMRRARVMHKIDWR